MTNIQRNNYPCRVGRHCGSVWLKTEVRVTRVPMTSSERARRAACSLFVYAIAAATCLLGTCIKNKNRISRTFI